MAGSAATKFNISEIDRFNDRIENVLGDPHARPIFEKYLISYKHHVMLKAFKLWNEASIADNFDEDHFLDLAEEIDGFNMNPFFSIQEDDRKLSYIKQECCRILSPVHPRFVEYLHLHHSV
ncbi:unnamed protein product [Acanthoscelides obtectus]|uniref:Uncharacterized protein n=1 Tax=Acanthoscelides obtectus TaxID=200917 RepID=A0A9P0PJP4_ACAOB|nr:unnamed protein product [Acanthoscelides obtectus]CAK1651650.1 hypothetical protein AOBTE_LOCUS17376 [Acanthoscelides obtectus]